VTAAPATGSLAADADGLWRACFQAMASPCEVLIDGLPEHRARPLAALACNEALRIERTWSRYRDDTIVSRINRAAGQPVEVDPETARLIDFGAALHQQSAGAFDLSSGVLGRLWRFDGGGDWPAADAVTALLRQVGWHRAQWDGQRLQMPAGMALDFGGIGKEYAVDRTLALLSAAEDVPMLVNFGGDLAANRPRRDGQPWQVGILESDRQIRLRQGAIATSGDAYRHVWHQGQRYSHILDARTGYPVAGAPRAVTVAAPTCSAAGALSTLAMLHGPGAETFLDAQQADYHVLR